MAKVLGKSGRYLSDEVVRKTRRMLIVIVSVLGVFAVVEGMLLASFVPVRLVPMWIRLPVVLAILPAMWFATRWGNKKLEALDKRRADMRRGADGEMQVGHILSGLPDDFCVINDLTTPHGNLDHVVIGPTGVFVLDTKSWRGIVSADGQGELLVNGRPTDKSEVSSSSLACSTSAIAYLSLRKESTCTTERCSFSQRRGLKPNGAPQAA